MPSMEHSYASSISMRQLNILGCGYSILCIPSQTISSSNPVLYTGW